MNSKKKINILMISSSSSLGGGTKHMFLLGENLKNSFEICYAIPKNNIFRKFLNSQNHIEISERRLNIFDIYKLIQLIKLKSIDIIHAHGKGAGLIARILVIFKKKPLIYTFHGIHLKCHSFAKRIVYIFYEFVLGGLDSAKVLVSKSEKEYARESRIYLGKDSIVINNAVPNMPKKEFKGINKTYIKKKSSEINVISLCRFVRQKNINDILKISKKIPNIQFSIIGEGPLFKEIKNSILKYNIKNVDLLGKKENVYKYLYTSDIFLSTSLYEGLPMSILEAMSIGLPIVASNVTGNCDTIVNGKSGFLYELNDIYKAADYINQLSMNDKLRKNMGNSAFERQRHLFSEKLMLINYRDLYMKQIL